jgi:hypothetical protein
MTDDMTPRQDKMLYGLVDLLADGLDSPRALRNFLNYVAVTEPMLLPMMAKQLVGMGGAPGLEGADDGWLPTCDPAFHYKKVGNGVAYRSDEALLSPDRQADGQPMDYHVRLRKVMEWIRREGIVPADAPIGKPVDKLVQ